MIRVTGANRLQVVGVVSMVRAEEGELMNGRTVPRGSASHVAPGCALGGILGGGASMLVLRQVLVFWVECDVGVNAGANLMYLAIFVWPPLTLLNAAVFTVVFAVTARPWNRRAAFLTALVVLVGVAAVEWTVATPLLTPDDYPLTCG